MAIFSEVLLKSVLLARIYNIIQEAACVKKKVYELLH